VNRSAAAVSRFQRLCCQPNSSDRYGLRRTMGPITVQVLFGTDLAAILGYRHGLSAARGLSAAVVAAAENQTQMCLCVAWAYN